AYLEKYGVPKTIEDLDRHFVVHYSQSLGADEPVFEYKDGERFIERRMHSLVTVNSADAFEAACEAGLGIMQTPRWAHRESVRRGVLREVLPEFSCAPMPVSIVHAHGRNVPKRVRAVMEWIAQQ